MKHSFSFVIITDELLSSPTIQTAVTDYDCQLLVGKIQVITFILWLKPSERNFSELSLEYDPLMLELEDVSLQPLHSQTMITLAVSGRDIGCTTIRFVSKHLQTMPPLATKAEEMMRRFRNQTDATRSPDHMS